MEKREILEKRHQCFCVSDERERRVAANAGVVGMVLMFIVAFVGGTVKEYVFGVPGSDLVAIAFLGMGATNLYQYLKLKANTNLSAAVLFFAGAALFAFAYFDTMLGLLGT